MPQIPIIMPQLGESIAEASVISLLVKPGANVEADQDILEVETNKATMNVTAPCRGRIAKFLVAPNESYSVGTVLGYVDATAAEVERLGLDGPLAVPEVEPHEAEKTARDDSGNGKARQGVEPTVRGLPVPAHAAGASYMSPRMKA